MEWLRAVFVLLLLGRAIYTDFKKGVIENRNIGMGILTGFAWSMVYGGEKALLASIKMVVVVFVALFVLFLMKGLGAGDIKLLCALATFFPENIFGIICIAFLVAAGMALFKMLIRFVKHKAILVRGETLIFSLPIGVAALVILFWELL